MSELETIRDALPADLDSIAALHWACWQHTYVGVLDQDYLNALTPEMFSEYHKPRLNDPTPEQPFLLAADSAGQVRGFTRGGPTRQKSPTGDGLPGEPHKKYSAEVFAIYVAPDFQGRGLGWRLWNNTLQRLRDRGHRTFCVWVLADNAQARRFYERAGGALDGESLITLRDKAYRQVLYGWP